MPSKRTKPVVDMALPDIPQELLTQFVTGPMTAKALEAATRKFKKALLELALGAEMSHHLDYALGEAKPEDVTNHRNGKSAQAVLTDVLMAEVSGTLKDFTNSFVPDGKKSLNVSPSIRSTISWD
jgi:transposase-like protein